MNLRAAAVALTASFGLLGAVGCTPPPTPEPEPEVLAVAYSNLDGIDGFDPEADVLIAKLLDSSGDGTPSAGDSVVTNLYPLNVGATSFGSFQRTTHAVAMVDNQQPGAHVVVADAEGNAFQFTNEYDESERYHESGAAGSVTISDNHPGVAKHLIWVELDAPSEPDMVVRITEQAERSEPFIDVDVFT